MNSVLPGMLPASNPLSQLLSSEPVEVPLSPSEPEWKSPMAKPELPQQYQSSVAQQPQQPFLQSPSVTPLRIARQAILISQLSAQSMERGRLEMQYSKDLRLHMDITAHLPRLSYRFVDWPDSPLILGQCLATTILEIQNIGKNEITKIRIAGGPRDFVFFSHSLLHSQTSLSSPSSIKTHLWISTHSLVPGASVQIPVVLRG